MKKITLLLIVLIHAGAFAQNALNVTKLGQLSYTNILSDIWGYADTSGNEYALVGVTSGVSIVDVTTASAPVEKHFIAGASSIWRDIKTWSHYAYVIHDSYQGNSDGIMIIDLNTIDSANISVTNFFPSPTIGGQTETYDRSHNVYVDEMGVLYVFGCNIGVGGALMFDVAANPTNPPFLGAVNGNYYHDGVARGDTLYGAAIYAGRFEVVNVSNKSNPQLMASQVTPNNFTHNIWFSPDNKTVFTTDEKQGAYITSYDVSDLNNITELDRIRTSIFDPNQVIPHNTHVMGDFLVNSYYTSGLQIVDASHPEIMIETAYFDTSPFQGDGFEGAWGAYPYLPSGNILVTDRQQGLFVLQTPYPRASFFTAFVKDSVTGNPIVSAQVDVQNSPMGGSSNIFGNFRDGQLDTGNFQVLVSKAGYFTDTLMINLQSGVVTTESIALRPLDFSMSESGVQSGILIYPNPSQNEINIEFTIATGERMELLAYNLKGQLVWQKAFSLVNAKSHLEHSLPQGVYLLKLQQNGEEIATRKFVVAP